MLWKGVSYVVVVMAGMHCNSAGWHALPLRELAFARMHIPHNGSVLSAHNISRVHRLKLPLARTHNSLPDTHGTSR